MNGTDTPPLSADATDAFSGGVGRPFVLGDVHGAHRALVQVLERSGFDRQSDRLIFLGDVVDGWPDSRQCIDELLTIPNLVALLGNHDEWFRDWVDGEHADYMWTTQGGQATLECYGASRGRVPPEHREYLRKAKLWHEDDGRMFVHGGWPWYMFPHPMGCPDLLTWDRELWSNARSRAEDGRIQALTQFREVYIGHTTTTRHGFTEPAHQCEVWNMDQGAGYEGKLSIMDIDTKEFWQSDPVGELYPEAMGRRAA